jgi:hypothetical protein
LKLFGDEPKPHPPCPNIFFFSCLYSAPKHFSPTYLPATYLLPTFPPPTSYLPPPTSDRHHQSESESTRAGTRAPEPE